VILLFETNVTKEGIMGKGKATEHEHLLKLERQRRYREKHRDKIREKAREHDAKARKTDRRKKWLEDNKEAHAQYKRDWYLRNRKDILKREKERKRVDPEEWVRRRKEYLKEYKGRPEFKQKKNEQGARYRERNRHKIRIRGIAYQAMKNGRLVKKPCEVCGKEKVEMHHDDYRKPLEVRWLCKVHHMIADGIDPIINR
jgi:hypothetical protein